MTILALLLLLSNQPAPSPLGGTAITNDADYHAAELKGQDLSEAALKKYDAGETLDAKDTAKLRQAVELYDKMAMYTPAISPLFFASGKIHHILGEDAIAEERFRQAMLTFYNDAAARPQYAVGIRRTGAEASYQLALLLVQQPNKKAALEAADVAVHYVPESSAYHTIRGSILNEMRRPAEARKELNEAIRLDPTNQRATGLLKFISE